MTITAALLARRSSALRRSMYSPAFPSALEMSPMPLPGAA